MPLKQLAEPGKPNREFSGDTATESRRSWWAVAPAVALPLLPNVTCPACWPAYAALLSTVGVSFVTTSRYLFPLTLVFVALALASLAWGAWRRQRFGPFVVGLIGAGLLLIGRFFVPSNVLLYSGMVTFIAAAVWNGLAGRRASSSGTTAAESHCPNCRTLVPLRDVDT